jgi:hypothetical protein
MIELNYTGALILGVIVAFAWIAVWWTEPRRPPRPGE